MTAPHPNECSDLKVLRWRYATKAFEPMRKIEPKNLEAILEAVRLAPTSFGVQPFHVRVVSDSETKAAMRAAAYGQPQVESASHVLVFCAKPDVRDHADRMFTAMLKNGVPGDKVAVLEKNYRIKSLLRTITFSHTAWAARQAYIALAFALVTAAEQGIDACPMEGFSARKMAKALGLPKTLRPVALLALGYRSETETPRPKYRLPMDALISQG